MAATWTHKNWSRQQPKLADGDEVEDSNISQQEMHTAICKGVKGLIFRRDNLTNCDLPPDAKVERCNVGHVDLAAAESAMEVEEVIRRRRAALLVAVDMALTTAKADDVVSINVKTETVTTKPATIEAIK